MVAFNLTTNKLWWGKNGTWNNSGDPSAGTGEIYSGLDATAYYAAITVQTNAYVTVNFGATAFSHTVPTGFREGFYE
jgi:acyl-CoA hydrolase